MFEQIKEMLVERFGEENITMETKIKEDLDADSLDVVELIMEIEEAFGVEVNEDEAQKLVTVGDIVTYVEKNQ